MKVIDLIKMFDEFDSHIVIWHVADLDSEKSTYRGPISNIPYWLTTCSIIGNICTTKYENEHGVVFGAICIDVED